MARRTRNMDPNYVPDGRRGAPHLCRLTQKNARIGVHLITDEMWNALDWSTAQIDGQELVVWCHLTQEEVPLRAYNSLGPRKPKFCTVNRYWMWDPWLDGRLRPHEAYELGQPFKKRKKKKKRPHVA